MTGLEQLGDAADELASTTHKALTLATIILRDRALDLEASIDLQMIDRACSGVMNRAADLANELWKLAHEPIREEERA